MSQGCKVAGSVKPSIDTLEFQLLAAFSIKVLRLT